ncbi:MAG TPA: bifunctional diaminohydroxyphosphoribosylaminopyrimidine deaminase/5-amino-6-(5-phosphoribosylamino)uracil reductase RibD [Noviherbaspirillum sp.]|jgi:diaminohydroxyphosphoribosylaminopyrimidine deaminase/5-amino-6-(5-phosphoribosylamino)uracil reductase|uniref:bifunctional diaminohydroxyphosphoribosylaminopyrimidine deaminase/5-amino-6-(5-phosphoribosylamino)uracil reductase RibD n=1 Tax=Noviherbaspirillum sp. TaxID=1926288 RepID=UPI002F950358
MALALAWAAKGMFTTSPNPRVGCVIVKDGQVIGEGHTQPPGQAHAEIQALGDAASRGHDVRGATAYVTLEPCSHYGRTPPCADALVRAGLSRVVVALRDPNPLVGGQGLEKLRAAGIAVDCGVGEDQARELNIGFLSRMQHGRPWVRMKTAASLDGGTALHNGQSQWITSSAARDDGHWWRARACAILTGIGTVQQDDPRLDVRAVATPRQPLRIVVDSELQIDPAARVLTGGHCLVIGARENTEKQARLRAQGAEVVLLPNAHGKVDLPALLKELGRREINELHVEAGFKLNGSLIRENCVDELLVYLAPSLLGDAQRMFALPAPETLAQRRQLAFHEIKQIGADLRILARFN